MVLGEKVAIFDWEWGRNSAPRDGQKAPCMRSRYTFPRSRINIHGYSFFPRTAKLWNNLPLDLCNSPDLGSF